MKEYTDYLQGIIQAMAKGKAGARRRWLFAGWRGKAGDATHSTYGSYTYTAKKLMEKGILMKLEGVDGSAALASLRLTISSNEVRCRRRAAGPPHAHRSPTRMRSRACLPSSAPLPASSRPPCS